MAQTKLKILFIGLIIHSSLSAQVTDSLKTNPLHEIVIYGKSYENIHRLPKSGTTYLWAGTKNEVISIQQLDANIAEKTPRQIFAKVPGVFVYDMDGSGNQVNIATRGLDPHRGWEFNIRKNGVITNSDMYAYPASHYSMPMEAVDRIEIVRGTGSLQYGAQFGGMINYVSKGPDTTKTISFESTNTIGSFNLMSTYNAIGGAIGKFQYYVYYSKRHSDGYRDQAESDSDAQALLLIYRPNKKLSLTTEIARSYYLYRTPGPLTDSMFHANPRQATRSRNYFCPEIFVPSIKFDYDVTSRWHISTTFSAVLGNRSSVQFDKGATIVDKIDPATDQFAARQVDIDNFNSYTVAVRSRYDYTIGNVKSILLAGVEIFDNDLHRRQLGKGTTGTDYTLERTTPGWGRDLHFKTDNVAIFVENSFEVLPRFIVKPGMRFENGTSVMSGVINYPVQGGFPDAIKHNFPLLGLSMDYTFSNNTNVYGGFSQAYRPVVFKDIIPGSIYESSSDDLKDAKGYNIDVGYRGHKENLKWDVSLFQLRYDNRMGVLYDGTDVNGNALAKRTNIGDSRTRGAEIFLEYAWYLSRDAKLKIFTSTSYFDARYLTAVVRNGKENMDVTGNRVESVPEWISRNGISLQYKLVSLSALYSYTVKSFADPLNTVTPSASGSVGVVPSYGILDVNASVRVADNILFRLNLNNVLNEVYFTKRPTMYPGPGVWSSDGRSMNCSFSVRF